MGEGEGEVQLDTPRRRCPCLAAASVGGAVVWWWYVMVRYDVRRLVSVVASSKAHPGFVQKMEQSASSVAVVVAWEGHALAIGNTAA